MRTRIEILKGNDWIELYLGDEKVIKYNVVINKVGTINNRDISHSNTFSIPYVSQNIQALDINRFNPIELASAFNKKYEAKYYVREKLLQIGYVIVNNTDNGLINLNFIDAALGVIDKWGVATYQDLLKSGGILPSGPVTIPSDYATNIASLNTFNLSHSAVVSPTTNVGSRGYKLSLFPNNLNAIGDKFQVLDNGTRLVDGFNPYQSRPIWNAKAFFDMITESFGYTPIYDPSVDWDRLKKTYFIESKLDSSSNSDEPYTTHIYSTIASNSPFGYQDVFNNGSIYTIYANVTYNPSDARRIGDYNLAASPVDFFIDGFLKPGYKTSEYNILKIHTDNLDAGSITWIYDASPVGSATPYTAWRHDSNPNIIIWKSHSGDITENTDVNIPGFYNRWTLTIDRSNFTPPSGSSVPNFLGVHLIVQNVLQSSPSGSTASVYNMKVIEKYLSSDTISYDESEQIESQTVDLTFSAPKLTIKDLLTAVMRREGILMDINNKLKEIRFFTYGSYKDRRDEGNYSDWSDYFIHFSVPLFNTDYGNEYARVNEVGLSSPFPGNTAKITLANQGPLSKYKDFVQNLSDKLKDVSSIVSVPTTPAHYEYTNLGFGVVEDSMLPSGTLTQYRADGSTQGTFSGLPYIWNVNGLEIPAGISQWYELIDIAVRCIGTFLIPVDVIKDLKIYEPIYVERLGGFFIIEEIEEYIDGHTPVKVKLIKLLD
jgi:hypothetical protein